MSDKDLVLNTRQGLPGPKQHKARENLVCTHISRFETSDGLLKCKSAATGGLTKWIMLLSHREFVFYTCTEVRFQRRLQPLFDVRLMFEEC